MADITFFGEELYVQAVKRCKHSGCTDQVEIILQNGVTVSFFDPKKVLKDSESK